MLSMRQSAMIAIALNLCLFPSSCPTTTSEPAKKGLISDSTALLPSRELLSYEQQQGKILYMKYCTICHGDEGKGDGFNAFNLDPRPRDFTDAKRMAALSDERLIESIVQGGRGVNRSLLMPSWGGRLSSQEREYIASYVRWFGKRSN